MLSIRQRNSPSSKERKKRKKFVLFSAYPFICRYQNYNKKKTVFQMSESEDLESLKVTELQNELKKRGLDTKGRKADLIIRLRQAINNGIEGNHFHLILSIYLYFSFLAGETSNVNPDISDEESAPAVVKDETSSPSSVS
jgi:hypothetical protein